jgi:hypothetical protein
MNLRTAILALALVGGLMIIGIGMFGLGYFTGPQAPAISVQEAARIVFAQFPNSRILVMQLNTNKGQLEYEVDLITVEEHKKEIHINAENGQVEKVLTVIGVAPPVV